MALDVKVKIELSKTTSSVGFGIPLLLECGVDAPVDYAEYYNIDEVITAGFAAETNIYKAANAVFSQTNRPEKIAICQTAGTAVETLPNIVSKGWRQLVLVNGDVDEFVGVADYIETTKDKMLFLDMNAEEFETFKTSIANKEYDRTVIFVNATENAAAALVGETSGRTAGSFTYKFKTLKGVVAEDMTDTALNALHEAGAIGYVTKAGDDITSEGISQSGKYIDITDSIDYVIQNIEYRVQKVFNTNAKVAYDDNGIALLRAAVTGALQDAANNGIIAVTETGAYDYSVTFQPRSATTEADRASREYKYGSFRFALAGAIHYCEVYGEITY